VLASYRFFFSANHGVEVNYDYSLNTQSYGLASGPLGVKANQLEATAAYVYRHSWKGFSRWVEAGVAGMVFDPTDAPGASTQTRAACVYGAGADFNLTKRMFLRAAYRGFVYNSPTFDLALAIGADRVTPSCRTIDRLRLPFLTPLIGLSGLWMVASSMRRRFTATF
jgi:opacity protein-like surface antigen